MKRFSPCTRDTINFMFTVFNFSSREMLSLVGGGGKTSFMRRLGEHTKSTPTILTTTTKIGRPVQWGIPFYYLTDLCPYNVNSLLIKERVIVLAKIRERDKMIGFAPENLNILHENLSKVMLIVEADGAKGYPFKHHEIHEPVIPLASTHLIVFIGAEIFIHPPDSTNTFRFNALREKWKIQKKKPVSLKQIRQIVESKDAYLRHAPPMRECKRTLIINKSDLLNSLQKKYIIQFFIKNLKEYNYFCLASIQLNKMDYFTTLRF